MTTQYGIFYALNTDDKFRWFINSLDIGTYSVECEVSIHGEWLAFPQFMTGLHELGEPGAYMFEPALSEVSQSRLSFTRVRE